MTKFIPARPAHPIDSPLPHAFMSDDMAWLDATGAIAQEAWLTEASAGRPPWPVGQGLSL